MILGIHHVTAITADGRRNVEFYCGVLGLRMVKQTVNFDDPGSYHLYFGDEQGRPGTIMTFFVWPGAQRGRIGPPQVTATAFAVPQGSMEFWTHRLRAHGVEPQAAEERFGDPLIGFADPDGLRLELTFVANPPGIPWLAGPVPPEHAIHGFHGVTISLADLGRTARLLTDDMGFAPAGNEGTRFRYRAQAGAGFASTIELVSAPRTGHSSTGAGTVHHIAFRTPSDAAQQEWREALIRRGYRVSPVMDRNYFHSIYFQKPGGVLFEIATDTPGFTTDQTLDQLGAMLMLPPWFEHDRQAIERNLPPLRQTSGNGSISKM